MEDADEELSADGEDLRGVSPSPPDEPPPHAANSIAHRHSRLLIEEFIIRHPFIKIERPAFSLAQTMANVSNSLCGRLRKLPQSASQKRLYFTDH